MSGRPLIRAAALVKTEVIRRGDVVLLDSPLGKGTVRFVPRNEYGVIDHDVTLPSGTTVTNSVRVLAHPEGSEIVFTIRQIDLTDDEFDRGVVMVEADPDRLKRLAHANGRAHDGASGRIHRTCVTPPHVGAPK